MIQRLFHVAYSRQALSLSNSAEPFSTVFPSYGYILCIYSNTPICACFDLHGRPVCVDALDINPLARSNRNLAPRPLTHKFEIRLKRFISKKSELRFWGSFGICHLLPSQHICILRHQRSSRPGSTVPRISRILLRVVIGPSLRTVLSQSNFLQVFHCHLLPHLHGTLLADAPDRLAKGRSAAKTELLPNPVSLRSIRDDSTTSYRVSIRAIMDQDRRGACHHIVRVVGDPALPASSQLSSGLTVRRGPWLCAGVRGRCRHGCRQRRRPLELDAEGTATRCEPVTSGALPPVSGLGTKGGAGGALV